MRQLIITLQQLACFAIPFLLSSAPIVMTEDGTLKLFFLCLAPIVAILGFPIMCGLLSLPGRSGIKRGRIERSLDCTAYFVRRLHATPWTLLYYTKPLYHLMLSMPAFRHLCFRLFGYKGNTKFTVYPDTWLRDLPLLDIGKNAYLSNKSSIAPNICLIDGTILVDGIKIGENSIVGHGSIIGPGTKMGANTELATKVSSGIRVRFGDNVKVHELCTILHGAVLEDNVVVEPCCFLGLRCKIGPGIRIKEGSHIHKGVRIRTQEEADQYYSEETGALTRKRTLVAAQVAEALGGLRATTSSANPLQQVLSSKSESQGK